MSLLGYSVVLSLFDSGHLIYAHLVDVFDVLLEVTQRLSTEYKLRDHLRSVGVDVGHHVNYGIILLLGWNNARKTLYIELLAGIDRNRGLRMVEESLFDNRPH